MVRFLNAISFVSKVFQHTKWREPNETSGKRNLIQLFYQTRSHFAQWDLYIYLQDMFRFFYVLLNGLVHL